MRLGNISALEFKAAVLKRKNDGDADKQKTMQKM